MLSQRIGCAHSILCASPEYVGLHGEPASLDDLRQQACVEFQSPLAPRGDWSFDGPDGEEIAMLGPFVFSVNLADGVAVALCEGMGVGYLPVADAQPHLQIGRLLHLLRRYTTQPVQYFAVYSPRHSFDSKLKTWIQFLREQMPMLSEWGE